MRTPAAWGEQVGGGSGDHEESALRFVQTGDGSFFVLARFASNIFDGLVREKRDPLDRHVGEENSAADFYIMESASFAAVRGGGGFYGAIDVAKDALIAGTPATLRIERYDGNGAAIGHIDVLPASGERIDRPTIAISSPSAGLIAYESVTGGTTSIMLRTLAPSTNAVGAATVIATGLVGDPQAIALADGRMLVMWSETIGGIPVHHAIRAGVHLPDGSLQGSITLAEGGTDDYSPSIAPLANGGFVVAYVSQTYGPSGNGGDIVVRAYDAGLQVTGASVFAGGAHRQQHPSIAATPDGGFVVAWQDLTDGFARMQAFGATASPQGPAAVIGAAVDGRTALLGLADGRVVYGQDTAELTHQIFDPRAQINAPAYPAGWQVGTVGADAVTAGPGASQVHGWDGDDAVGVANALNGRTVSGGAGVDTLSFAGLAAGVALSLASSGAQATGGAGSLTVGGFERVTGTAFDDILAGDDLDNVLTGGGGDDRIDGGLGADTLLGGAGVDDLRGGGGDDVLNGAAGADRMRGGAGDDVYVVNDAGDLVDEAAGAGVDEVRSAVAFVLPDAVEDLTLVRGARAGTGNALGNRIAGTGGHDALAGLEGDDVLLGGAGNDRLDGGDGADLLAGGVGKDVLTGGAGRDVFRFAAGDTGATRFQGDVIADFSRADRDRINLQAIDADADAAGDQAFLWIGATTFSGHAGELRFDQAGGNTFVHGDTDGDGLADFFVRLDGLHALAAGVFVL